MEWFGHRLAKRLWGAFYQGFADQPSHDHTGNHEGAGYPENFIPWQSIGKDQREGAWDQPGNPIGVNVYRVAEPQFVVV